MEAGQPSRWRRGTAGRGRQLVRGRGLRVVFAGKELPTIYHWYQADTAGDLQLLPGLVLSTTNHEGAGPRRVGASGSMSAHGAIDMAGNMREWSANPSDGVDTGRTRRRLVGSRLPVPLCRRPAGIRPIARQRVSRHQALEKEEPSAADAPLAARRVIDRTAARPASDAEFAIFTRFFERRPVPLDPRVESTDDSSPHWIKQRISFAAGYSNERMTALLYLPRSARPPYQVVIQMAGAATFYRRSSATEKDIFGWSYAEY